LFQLVGAEVFIADNDVLIKGAMPVLDLGIISGTAVTGDDVVNVQTFKPESELAGKGILYRPADKNWLAVGLDLLR